MCKDNESPILFWEINVPDISGRAGPRNGQKVRVGQLRAERRQIKSQGVCTSEERRDPGMMYYKENGLHKGKWWEG